MASTVVFDLLRKNPNFGSQVFNSKGLFYGSFVGASSSLAATSFAIATPFAFRALFGDGSMPVAYCDAGATLGDDISSSAHTASGNKRFAYNDAGAILGEDFTNSIRTGSFFQNDALRHSMKQYDIQLKPLFSAFHWKNFGITVFRSFMISYMPLFEPRPHDEDGICLEIPEEHPVDLVEPLKKSVKLIGREISVSTSRRILERLSVQYISQRMAWKLTKDVPKSAIRKAGRGMPIRTFCFRVSKTTLRGHLLGVVAQWLIQVGIDIYRTFSNTTKSEEDGDAIVTAEQVGILGNKIFATTVRYAGALIFASVGAGIGAALIRPSTGQWVGCVLGEFVGPIIVTLCFEKHLHLKL